MNLKTKRFSQKINSKALLFFTCFFFSWSNSVFSISIGLIGQWHLDGNTVDSSGNKHNGINTGATIVNTGICGKAYYFNGSSKIDVGNIDFSQQIYSVNTWFRTSDLGQADRYPHIISKIQINSQGWGTGPFVLGPGNSVHSLNCVTDCGAPGFGAWKDNGGVFGMGYKTITKFNARDGVWHMLTATYKTGEQRFYVDGKLINTGSYAGNLPVVSASLLIGNIAPFSSYLVGFKGDIDEVSIYNRVLAATEVSSTFVANKAGNCMTSDLYDLTTQPSLDLDFATNYDAKNVQTVELKNTSATPITVSNVIISDAGSYWVNLFTDSKLACRAKHYTPSLKNFTIPAKSSCTIGVGFSPFDDMKAGQSVPATITLKTLINGVATDKIINLTGIGRAQRANFYNNNKALWGQDSWAVSELKNANPPINTTLVGELSGYSSAKFWYGSVINPVLQKSTASIGNLVVFAQNNVNANGHVGVVIQTTPVVTMLSMNDVGAGARKWSVRPVDWYPSATAAWSPLITGFNATDANKHYGFISWKNTLY